MDDRVQETILVVDDDHITALALRFALERAGFTVIHAASARESLDLLHDGGPVVGLVVMDIDLGEGMNGFDAAAEILKGYELPVVFHSSHTEKELIAQAERISGYGYVAKGHGDEALLSHIRLALKLHRAVERLRDLGDDSGDYLRGPGPGAPLVRQ